MIARLLRETQAQAGEPSPRRTPIWRSGSPVERLELDDVRAEVAEHRGDLGGGEQGRQVENAQAGEGGRRRHGADHRSPGSGSVR